MLRRLQTNVSNVKYHPTLIVAMKSYWNALEKIFESITPTTE